MAEIYVRVRLKVRNAKDFDRYTKAKERIERSTQRIRLTDDTIQMLDQIKDTVQSVRDLLRIARAIKRLNRSAKLNVDNYEMGCVIFHVHCYCPSSLGKLWCEHRNGKLAITLRESLLADEILQLMGDDISIETTIDPDQFKRCFLYQLRDRYITG